MESQLISSLFESGVHFGYSKTKRHPTMKPFIYGMKNHSDIIDLEQTADMIKQAQELIATAKTTSKTILFVGSKPEVQKLVQDAAMSIDMPYVERRWIGGTLTNWSEIKRRIDMLEDLDKKREKGELVYQTKKEKLMIEREIDRLIVMFGGVRNLKKIPDLLVLIDPRKEMIALKEAVQMGVPVIALANTDCDIRDVSLVIPGNDTNASSVSLVLSMLTDAYKAA